MIRHTDSSKKIVKQRLTAFVDPILVRRAKVRGALEGFTISEVVEKALESYAPEIEKDADEHIHLKFIQRPSLDILIQKKGVKSVKGAK